MGAKSLVMAGVLVLAMVCVALAGFCPLCHKQIPDDQKYCADCAAGMDADKVVKQSEREIVADVIAKRNEYRATLEALRKFYVQRGDATGTEKVDKELEDFTISRKYRYENWENTVSMTLTPTDNIREADLLFRDAEKLRTDIVPFGRERKLREAADIYQSIIDKYPTSVVVDDSAFRLGEVYEELGGPDTLRAARFFVLCFTWNPKTELPAQFRAARLYEQKLKKYDYAAWLYKLASTDSKDLEVRKRAVDRLAQLKKSGYNGDMPADALALPNLSSTEEGKPTETTAKPQ